jgi:CspA family cold shock protein
MAKGNVKWFDQKRGYGFLSQKDGDDVFVYYKSIQKVGFKTLKEGEFVEFEIRARSNGHSEAVNVKIIQR